MKTFAETRDGHTDTSDPDACWLWGGYRDRDGYGRHQKPHSLAHRAAYIDEHGAIPTGLQIDHLCRTRACVNPRHLEAVTPRVNTMRSEAASTINARKTHCPQGHPYDEANTYVSAKGSRHCRRCGRARRSAYGRRQRSELAAEAAA